MVTHSSILGLRIPWTEEPGGLQSIGLQRAGHHCSDLACTHVLLVNHDVHYVTSLITGECLAKLIYLINSVRVKR